ncbi:MAG: XdhC family protein [Candidatus Kapabacteria bacterium]|nr:XdhC family protein [Candidatus Kapabacteria bacterium]
MKDFYQKIVELKEAGTNAMLCTIVQTKGSTPLKAGAKMIVISKEATFGTVGGGSIEAQTIDKALELLSSNKQELIHIELYSKEGTSCGGTADIFIEPLIQNYKLYIFGAGHVGKALAYLSESLDFDITVIDDRGGIFNDWKDGNYKQVVTKFGDFLKELKFDAKVFIAIITYNHKIDWEILSFCAGKPWCYLGMMGSQSKVKAMKKGLLNLGISKEIINKINMPIGMEINSESATEIAVSIAAQMIKQKNAEC